MRVLFLTHSWPRFPGDAPGAFLLHLAVALRAEGITVAAIAPGGDALPADETFEGIPVHRFRYAPRRYETLAYTGQMAEAVERSVAAKFALLGFLGAGFASATRLRREFAPDVVHAHWWFPGGLVGTWVAGLGSTPLVTTLHGSDVRLARTSPLGRSLLRHVLGHSDAVTTVSSWLASEARAMMPALRPVVAPMPVPVELFAPGGERGADRLLFVGRLNEQKGIELLLRAVAGMRTRAELDVVGDGPAAGRLKEAAESLGLDGRVHWHGALPQPQLPPFYRRAAALVVPSLGEGLGLVAVEAQLCETPVVAFASGGLADTLEDGVTGYLVPPGDVDALSARLDDLLRDPQAAAIGRNGRQSALARFAPESAARRYAQLYRGLRPPRET